jgi:hypothetical protein
MTHATKNGRPICGAEYSAATAGDRWVSAYTEDKYKADCAECRSMLGLTLRCEEPARPKWKTLKMTPDGIGPEKP